ncbi:putative sorting nexin-13 isoform X1 [Apostichopus japonicus]|uniref:Putative sorting nexin-13 isoform X1 n=1 Tax=Stichopus japonicus TaxID=307972 RepID=A0A2G8L913_STIJA|nr:putative sorting nexin-13 isoform X1 [Apostichopus japonicus]
MPDAPHVPAELYMCLKVKVSVMSWLLILLYNRQAVDESSAVWDKFNPNSVLQDYPVSLKQVFEEMKCEPPRLKCDKRLTGASIIDEQLQEIIRLTMRDYAHPWYYEISNNKQFLHEIQQTAQNVIITLANRAKEVDWVNYVTRTGVEDFASHIRLFHSAQAKHRKIISKEDVPDIAPSLESVFFDLEIEMEDGICRDEICSDEGKELDYLRDVIELLLFIVLPAQDFQSKPMTFLVREILACYILKPMLDMFSDPDYVNQNISWLCKDTTFTTEAFLNVIKTSSSIDELEAIIKNVDHEMFKQRSRDANKTNREEADVKQQIKSLQFLKQLCQETIERIMSGEGLDVAEEVACDGPIPKTTSLYSLPLNIILVNSIAVSYFIDFMRKNGSAALVFFWHTVESYRVTAEQQLSALHLQKLQPSSDKDSSSGSSREPSIDLEGLRAAALNIYHEYLAEDAANRVNVEPKIIKRTLLKIKYEEPSDAVFDEAQQQVYNILHEDQHFPAFKQSVFYMRCLAELDLLEPEAPNNHHLDDESSIHLDSSPEPSIAESSEDLSSMGSHNSSVEHLNELDMTLTEDRNPSIVANINQATMIRDQGRKYAVYTIHVSRTDEKGTVEIWDVFRRYSEFHDLHMNLSEKFPDLKDLPLPAKKIMKNTTKSFLDKRGKALTLYIKELLEKSRLMGHPGMSALVHNFLEPGVYNRGRGQLARRQPTRPLQNIGRVSSVTDVPDDDNIALRVMMLLMDEMFDLRHRDQWLRRQLVMLLKQIFRAAFGSKINTRIIEGVEALTSTESVADYIKQLKESFWPTGILAEEMRDRSEETKMRARVVSKTQLYGSIPDELKNFIGTETTRRGMIRTFDMLQMRQLNKRLMFVFLEGIVKLLFPESNFEKNFQTLLSQSSRIRAKREKDEREMEEQKAENSNAAGVLKDEMHG